MFLLYISLNLIISLSYIYKKLINMIPLIIL